MDDRKLVLFISDDEALIEGMKSMLKDFYRFDFMPDLKSSKEYIHRIMPHVIIIDMVLEDYMTISVLNEIKNDPVYGQIPVIIVLPEKNIAPIWDYIPADDFLWRICLNVDLLVRISLSMRRAERMIEINPLTRLPGNIAIAKHIQKKIFNREIFAMGYVDIDYFKPFNDKYGFSRGDKILKFLGNLILNKVKGIQPHNSFIGHIGGDDFVFTMDLEYIEDAALEIISDFDKEILFFYDEEDRMNGYIESIDREGIKKRYSIMCISIGITHTGLKQFSHYSEMAEVASEMKRYAKSCQGSCYRIDKRTSK